MCHFTGLCCLRVVGRGFAVCRCIVCRCIISVLGYSGSIGGGRFALFFVVISYLDISQGVGSVVRNIALRRSCVWEWIAIGLRCLELASVAAWGGM